MSARIWMLPNNLLTESLRAMTPKGRLGHEGLALWFGKITGDVAHVSHLIAPYGSGVKTSPLHLALSANAIVTLTDFADKNRVCLIGQTHSHPENYVDLSLPDRQYGIKVQGYLSVVVPYYAQRPLSSISDCGVHVYYGADYRRLSDEEIMGRIISSEAELAIVRVKVSR